MRFQELIRPILTVSLISLSPICRSSIYENSKRDLSSASDFSETGRHIVNVFSVLNDLYNRNVIQISSCTVVSQSPSEYKRYRRFSTCLLKGTRFWKEDEKTIVVHFHLDKTKMVNLIVVWKSLSKLNLLKSFFTSRNKSNHLIIKMDSSETASEVIDFLVNFPQFMSIQESLFSVDRLNMDEIDLEITPYKKDEFLVRLSLLQQNKIIYDVDVITNYSSNNKYDFFVLPVPHFE